MLRFEETVNVTAKPLDLERLRVEWTRHWNLSGREVAPTGAPSHAELREQSRRLSDLSGTHQSQSLPLTDLLALAGQVLAKGLKSKGMPPADPHPAPKVRPAPLEVETIDAATPTPTPDGEPPEITRRPHE